MNAPLTPAHSVYAPSSAHRWTACTASAEAIATLPEQEEGDEAAEGTRAHDELERVLASGGEPNPDHPAAYAVALAVDYVRKLPPGQLWIEQRVFLTPQIWGRCDVAHWEESSGILTIVDLKNGQRAVDVEENEQLRIYAAGTIATHGIKPRHIRLVVVQPRDWRPFVPRVKQWVESAESLANWVQGVVGIPTAPKTFTAGPQCRDCPLFSRCSASLDMLANIGALVSGLVQPENVRPEQVAGFLAMRKPVEDAYKKFTKHWEGMALKIGSPPPDMKLVTTAPHRAWLDPEAARALVVEQLGSAGLDVPTPAQAIERGLDAKVVHEMAPKPDGGPALAFANDKRKSWAPKSAAGMFALK